jgi:hypothetical protein
LRLSSASTTNSLALNADNVNINGVTVATTGEVRAADKSASLRLLGSAGQSGIAIFPQGSCDITLNSLLSPINGAPSMQVVAGTVEMGSLKTNSSSTKALTLTGSATTVTLSANNAPAWDIQGIRLQ